MAEKTWKDKAKEMIYGDGEKPVARKDFTTNKRTRQATGDEEIPEEVWKRYNDILESGRSDISLEDLIVDYYGGKENLQAEIEKAKETKGRRDPKSEIGKGMGMDYEKIGEKIPVRTGGKASYYAPDDKEAYATDPVSWHKFLVDMGERGMSGTEEEKAAFEQFLKENRYTKGDFVEMLQNPKSHYMGAVEHEVGHHPTVGSKSGTLGLSGTHMSERVELSNQLGRIQREAYQLYGERFTPDTLENFMKLQDDVPEKERFKNFSPDTRRGLRELYDAYKGEQFILTPENRVWPAAKQLIPEFVKRKERSDGRTS